VIRWSLGGDRILQLTMDDPTQRTNTMTDDFLRALRRTIRRLEAEKESYDGVVLTSGKGTFMAGGDLTALMDAGLEDVPATRRRLDSYKDAFRRLEVLGKPVVAALNGTALGGGLEVALACHRRIALDLPDSRLGLPEVTWGLLPGAGGTTRVVRMLGVTESMAQVLVEGRSYSPAGALSIGLVDEVVATRDELQERARSWIRANPAATQPWDRHGYSVPRSTSVADLWRNPTDPRLMPAPAAVLAAAIEGSVTDLERAFAIETTYCADLICGRTSTNLIRVLFVDRNKVTRATGTGLGVLLGAAPMATLITRLHEALLDEARALVAAGLCADVVVRAARESGFTAGVLPRCAETSPCDGDDAVPGSVVGERLLRAMSMAATACLDQGLVRSAAEANVASVLGAGFPAWTGGAVRYAHEHRLHID
jgi:3-hydroxyacyl-CoA dehydrogenase / enoyl-CoA hydratase / 3-hydroxybutyryl-CoA epimerase